MKIVQSLKGLCAIPLLVLACSAGAPDGGADTSADTSSATAEESALSPAAMLRAFEEVALAVEQRQGLSGELASAWAQTTSARRDAEITALVGQIRSSAPSADLLSFGSEAIERYVTSFDPTVEAIQRHSADGTVDGELVGLVETLIDTIDRVAQSDNASGDRAATYCCVVKNEPTDCFQWHTSGVWAGSKCVAKGIGLNRSGSSLYKASCTTGNPMYCDAIH